ncbi:hypothetical protein JNW88_23505 [Micromonospora sp. ATA32]|nr:hypothetical protein [Micromonospora sp. ATA32]
MSEQPTQDQAAAFRAEQARRGLTPTAEVRAWAREQLAGARNTWTRERLAAVRARSEHAATDRRTNSPAA